jgi:hypothetical protein
VKLSELITPDTPAGTALFLQWEGYHVFSIPQREISRPDEQVRFFGVGGKRQNQESLIECALRECAEEIGSVVSRLESADRTYFLAADGTIRLIELSETSENGIRPRLILEKRNHSLYGSMANQDTPYYLVAYNASLISKPVPSNEIAGILYLKDSHLSLLRQPTQRTVAEMLHHGAQIESQPNLSISDSKVLIPHGTARFLIQQLP